MDKLKNFLAGRAVQSLVGNVEKIILGLVLVGLVLRVGLAISFALKVTKGLLGSNFFSSYISMSVKQFFK